MVITNKPLLYLFIDQNNYLLQQIDNLNPLSLFIVETHGKFSFVTNQPPQKRTAR